MEREELRQQIMIVDALGAVYANNQLRLLTTTDVLYYSKAGVYTAIGATPTAHASSHENGGADEISVAGLSGLLADAQTPLAHKTSHENNGSDEINVTGLAGLLADNQNPTTHGTSHQSGGGDSIKLDDLAAPDDNTDLNASTTAHGLLRKLDNTATNFLDGTGAWDSVKDSDLSLSDITTNNASTSNHGFLKKLSNVATEYMDGSGNWSTPAGGDTAAVRATKSGAQTLSNGATTALTFDTETFDTAALHSTSSDTSRLTAVTAGKYMCEGTVRFNANSTGKRLALIQKNAATIYAVQEQNAVPSPDETHVCVCGLVDLGVGDYVELYASQNSGGNLDVSASFTHFAMAMVAD